MLNKPAREFTLLLNMLIVLMANFMKKKQKYVMRRERQKHLLLNLCAWTVIWHRDSLNQIWNAMTILSSYKIKAGAASVSDAISTNYSDFTANCTSIQVQFHKSLIPCSRSHAILLSCYNSMTLKPMYNTISDAESVNLEISGKHGMIQHDHYVGNH